MPGNHKKPMPFLKIPSMLHSPLHLQIAPKKDKRTKPGNLKKPCPFGIRRALDRRVLSDSLSSKCPCGTRGHSLTFIAEARFPSRAFKCKTFEVDKVAPGHVFLRALQYSLVTLILPILHTYAKFEVYIAVLLPLIEQRYFHSRA